MEKKMENEMETGFISGIIGLKGLGFPISVGGFRVKGRVCSPRGPGRDA